MWYVGMDVHIESSSVCVLDEHGQRIVQKTIRGPWPKLVEWLKGLAEPISVCYEASVDPVRFTTRCHVLRSESMSHIPATFV